MIKLNETPVRTSRNFNINNIKLDNIIIPETINVFNNVKIDHESLITGANTNLNTKSDNNKQVDIKYGLSKELIQQVINNHNKKIDLKIDSKENTKRIVNFKFDKENLQLVEQINIEAEENSESTIIIKYESEDNISAYHNGIIDIKTHENAKLDIIIVNLMNDTSNNFLTIQSHLNENSKINCNIIDFGGQNSITNYYSNLIGDNSDNQINTIYLGTNNQVFDINYIAELYGKKANVNIEVQGALKDKAKKHFKGTIDFKKGCKKAKGNENESCMLLSNTSKSLALPMLLCSEEEVEGNHSCSSGKVSEKELFYIMSRGFSLKEAIKLLVRAKFNSIIQKINDEELQNTILNEIDRRIK